MGIIKVENKLMTILRSLEACLLLAKRRHSDLDEYLDRLTISVAELRMELTYGKEIKGE